MSVDTMNILPDVYEAIRNYTNKSFCSGIGFANRSFVVNGENNTIALQNPSDTDKQYITYFNPEDIIEFVYSNVNSKIMIIKSVDYETCTITTYQKLTSETIPNVSLVKLVFRGVPQTTINQMIDYQNIIASRAGLKSESLDGYSYELAGTNVDDNTCGYPKIIMNGVNSLKQLPNNRRKEYVYYGFLNVPYARYGLI